MSKDPIHPPTRIKVYRRDQNTCQYCGFYCVLPSERGPKTSWRVVATIDHVVPRIEGGSSRIENLVVACAGCNVTKGRRSPEWLSGRAVVAK